MNYAVITKVKAMYGKRFTDDDFSRLCDCRSIEECATYLKSHPAYTRAFDGTELRGIRLSRIEILLKLEYCLEFERLVKGLSEKERTLVQMFIGTYELDFILWALRNIGLNPLEKATFATLYEPLIRKYSKADYDMLINSQSRNQVIDALHGQYRAVIEKLLTSDGSIDYLTAENELWKAYYRNIADYIKKNCKKDDFAALFGTSVDIYNILRIFRLREYFDYPADEIIPFIIRPMYRLTDETTAKLCSSTGKKEFDAVLRDTPYKKLAETAAGEDIETLAGKILTEKAGKTLHFSKSAPAVIYSYMICKSREIDKIKTVIESVRYNLSREMIESYVGTKAKAD